MTNRVSRTTDHRVLAALTRDAALARIGRVRVMMLVGTICLTAVLAMVASALLPGKSFGSSGKKTAAGAAPVHRAPSTPTQTSSAAPQMPAPAGPAALGLQGPDNAPGPAAPAAPSPQPAPPPAQPAQPAPAPAPVAPSGGAVVSGGS